MSFKKTHNLIGSLSYASINAHNFNELSRRDDLESLGYVIMYMYFGKLDWQLKNDNIEIIDTKNNIIKNMKINIIHDEGLPNVLCEYMKSVRSMEFEEKPNYSILEDMFKREINVL